MQYKFDFSHIYLSQVSFYRHLHKSLPIDKILPILSICRVYANHNLMPLTFVFLLSLWRILSSRWSLQLILRRPLYFSEQHLSNFLVLSKVVRSWLPYCSGWKSGTYTSVWAIALLTFRANDRWLVPSISNSLMLDLSRVLLLDLLFMCLRRLLRSLVSWSYFLLEDFLIMGVFDRFLFLHVWVPDSLPGLTDEPYWQSLLLWVFIVVLVDCFSGKMVSLSLAVAAMHLLLTRLLLIIVSDIFNKFHKNKLELCCYFPCKSNINPSPYTYSPDLIPELQLANYNFVAY